MHTPHPHLTLTYHDGRRQNGAQLAPDAVSEEADDQLAKDDASDLGVAASGGRETSVTGRCEQAGGCQKGHIHSALFAAGNSRQSVGDAVSDVTVARRGLAPADAARAVEARWQLVSGNVRALRVGCLEQRGQVANGKHPVGLTVGGERADHE